MKYCCRIFRFLLRFPFLGGFLCFYSIVFSQEVLTQNTQHTAANELKGDIENLFQKGLAHREQIKSGQMIITTHLTNWNKKGTSKSSVTREITLAFDEKTLKLF